MTEGRQDGKAEAGGGAAPDSAADARMAEILSGSQPGGDLRKRLREESTAEASDLLGRLNALDFVNTVVGGATDMPERIGEYRIQGLLGKGGMGTVYLAFQEQLEREVALKVLSANWTADPTMRQRFRAEAKATAALHHRHIVPIYDYGEAQGILYFAMERVDGMSLDKHIAAARRVGRSPLPPLEAARRFAGVADALGLAHRRRLLHRDVKPGNILVAADGTLALTDFGLAKGLDQGTARLTSKGGGGFLGTLHYAPPEQVTGRELSPASDLYSLGVTLFEAVTGELPVEGKTTEALYASIVYGTPRRLRQALPKPPRDLEAVLDKLLAREPGDRYQDGEALSRDLLRIADGEPVQIRRQPVLLRLWRRMKKNPVLSGAVIAAAVLLLSVVFLARGLRQEKGQSLASRHQNHLARIVNDIELEAGPAAGPSGLLACLTGFPASPPPPSARVLEELRKAEADVPGDQATAALRAAYTEDPLPAATALLQEGRGHEARRLFDRAIGDALAGRTSADVGQNVRLYHLYLGRAVANLTAASSRLNDARMDLGLAAFMRPGATFPQALTLLLDVAQSPAPGALLERLRRENQAAAGERKQAIGALLWALAAVRPRPGHNLMAFELPHEDRKAIAAFAAQWLGAAPDDTVPDGSATGFATQLAGVGAAAAKSLNEPGALAAIVQSGLRLLDDRVHPESPLQGWRAALQMLQGVPNRPLLDADGRELSPGLQLLGWEALLRLPLSERFFGSLLPRFEQLRLAQPNLPGMLRVTALLHAAANTRQAADHARLWIEAAPLDAAAHRCRLQASLRIPDVDAALLDGMCAVQYAADPQGALQSVVAGIEAAAAAARLRQRERLQQLAAQFRASGGKS